MSTGSNVGDLSVTLGIDPSQFNSGLNQAQQATQQATQAMEMDFRGLKDNLVDVTAKTKRYIDQLKEGGGAGGGKGYGQGILQASRAIQDFQAAGLMGIVNNVEGIAAGFGMGAGVAGAVTVATVAMISLQSQMSKFVDSRNELEKLADQTRFAGSAFGDLELKIESAKTKLEKLAEYDAKSGIGGWIDRTFGGGAAGQEFANKMAASQFATMTENARADARTLGRRQSGVEAGLNFLDQKDADQDPDKVKRRAAAMKQTFNSDSRRDLLMGKATEYFAQNETGGDYTKARERAREMIGFAAQGLDEGFQMVRKITKDWQNQELNVQSSYYKLLSEENEKARQKELAGKRDIGGIDDIIDSIIEQAKKDDKQAAIAKEKEGIIDQMADVYYEMEMKKRKFSMVGVEDVFSANAGAGVNDPLDPLLKKLDTLGDRLEKVIDKGRRLN